MKLEHEERIHLEKQVGQLNALKVEFMSFWCIGCAYGVFACQVFGDGMVHLF